MSTIATVPMQVFERRGQTVNLFKIGYFCDEPCEKCNEKANYEVQEPTGFFWNWCGFCDKD